MRGRPAKRWFVDFLFAVVAGLFIVCVVGMLLLICESTARGEQGEPVGSGGRGLSPEALVERTVEDIQKLQPRVSTGRAMRLAEIIVEACEEESIPPRLVVSVAMRESSFDPRVERGDVCGKAGEVGLLQVHPRNKAALKLRPEGCSEALEGADCQIWTGVRWLAKAREGCPGSIWRWLTAYGTGRCLTEEQAGMHPGTRRAMRYFYMLASPDEEW